MYKRQTIKYDRNTYWLTYDANGGTYVARESGKYEQVMTVKGNDATTRVGYTFDGWYLDKEFTKEVGRTIELKEDTVPVSYTHLDVNKRQSHFFLRRT